MTLTLQRHRELSDLSGLRFTTRQPSARTESALRNRLSDRTAAIATVRPARRSVQLGPPAGRRVPAESTGRRGLVRKQGIMRPSWHAVILVMIAVAAISSAPAITAPRCFGSLCAFPPVIRCRGLPNAGSNRNATYLYSADS